MISISLGQRYERLLFATAPISLAAIIVCLVASASVMQKERVEARCYLQAAEVFKNGEPELNKAWLRPGKKDELWYIYYRSNLTTTWIHGSRVDACYNFVINEIDEGMYKESPASIVNELTNRAENLKKAPLAAYGITLPNEASVNLFITDIKVEFLLMTRILQAVLFPVLLLWLGSLYSTRYRESLLVFKADSLAVIFPHIINIYPAFEMPSFRKRNCIAPYVKPMACFCYAMIRVGLLSMFIVPPVGAYLYSLYLSGLDGVSYWYIASGGVVILFFVTTLAAEFLPMHYNKVFPDPVRRLG